MCNLDVIDRSVLDSLRELQDEDQRDIVAELAELFAADGAARLVALKQAIEDADAGRLEREAHALKSSCANLGAKQMSLLCLKLEMLGRAGVVKGTAALLSQLCGEFDRARHALEAEISSPV